MLLRAQGCQAEARSGIFGGMPRGVPIQKKADKAKFFSLWVVSSLLLGPKDLEQTHNGDFSCGINTGPLKYDVLRQPSETLEGMPRGILESIGLDYQTEGTKNSDTQDAVLSKLTPLSS